MTRGNGIRMKEGIYSLEIKKKFFTTEVVDAPLLEVFKVRLGGALSNLI